MTHGIVTPTGIALSHNGAIVPLAPTLTPLGEAIAAFLATNPEPCHVCGRFDCDCAEWLEWGLLDPDPHGNLSELQSMEIPF